MIHLPASFEHNTFERMVTFLNESNRIESIKEIDYHDPAYQKPDKGHFGAFVHSQQCAETRQPLTHRMIRQWQAMLTKEQVPFGHHIEEGEIGHIRGPNLLKNVRIGSHIPPDYSRVPTLLDQWIEEVNAGLKDQERLKDDAAYQEFLGRSFQKFEEIHPFADGNGRTGRLIICYIATYCGRPIIIINSDMIERNAYYRAHKTGQEMVAFMAGKVQEAVFGPDKKLILKTATSSDATQLASKKKMMMKMVKSDTA